MCCHKELNRKQNDGSEIISQSLWPFHGPHPLEATSPSHPASWQPEMSTDPSNTHRGQKSPLLRGLLWHPGRAGSEFWGWPAGWLLSRREQQPLTWGSLQYLNSSSSSWKPWIFETTFSLRECSDFKMDTSFITINPNGFTSLLLIFSNSSLENKVYKLCHDHGLQAPG
jgi:hypothetical protein